MGNVSDKQEYSLVNNPVNFDDVIKNNTNPKLINDIINDVIRSNNINEVFKNYDNETILNYYKSDSIIEILKLNNEKSLQLANALPANKENLIFRYSFVIPVNLLVIMSKNININILNEKQETFLFKQLEKGKMFSWEFDIIIKEHLKYITTLLKNVDNIDVNFKNRNNKTFFEKLISQKMLRNHNDILNLIQSLEKQNYSFNKVDEHIQTFLTQMLISTPEITFDLAKTMTLKCFDITTESRWLYHILTHRLNDIHNYIIYMFQRDDYIKLFFELYRQLYIDVWNDKFIIFIRKAALINVEKTIACLNYKDKGGNTIVHLIASYHDKLTLQFIVHNSQGTLKFGPNNDGDTPLMLYNESNLKTILQEISII